MLARGTRRRRGPTDAHDKKCAWCKHMRGLSHACTWKPRGPQDKFVSAADVSGACFGHMVASDRGGVPSCERVWVSHVAAAVKYESLVHTASAAATPRERGAANAAAMWFRQWGTVFAGVNELLKPGGRFISAGQHKRPWVAVPAACGHCGAWGVAAVSKISGGKRHFGRECCGRGSVVGAGGYPSSSGSGSGSECSSGSSSSDGGQVHRPAAKRKKRAAMPANALDDCMVELDCGRHPALVPAGYEAELRQYINIMFGSSTYCSHHCGECVPCMARVARKFERSAIGSLLQLLAAVAQGPAKYCHEIWPLNTRAGS